MTDGTHCKNCGWWKPEKKPFEGTLFGQCHRHPPLNVPVRRQEPWANPKSVNQWPYTGEGEWCGEFKPSDSGEGVNHD